MAAVQVAVHPACRGVRSFRPAAPGQPVLLHSWVTFERISGAGACYRSGYAASTTACAIAASTASAAITTGTFAESSAALSALAPAAAAAPVALTAATTTTLAAPS